MARLTLLVSIGLAVSLLPGGLAGPSCARKHHQAADCVSKCRAKWGWTGTMMGTDPWGSVAKPVDTTKDWDNVIYKACGSSVPPVVTTSTSTTPIAVKTTTTTTTSSSSSSSSTTTKSSSSTTSSVSSTRTSSSTTSTSTTTTRTPVAQGFVAASTTSTTAKQAPPTETPKQTAVQNAPPPPVNNPPANGGGGGTSQSDINAYLDAHNKIRSQHGAQPLSWDEGLATKALQWAKGCVFEHSGGSLGPFGENLAAGTGGSYGIETAIKSWTDEVSTYNSNNPVPSHFTQVVWKGSSKVGCALAMCNGIFSADFGIAKYYVCEYSSQGNIIGQFAANVQA